MAPILTCFPSCTSQLFVDFRTGSSHHFCVSVLHAPKPSQRNGLTATQWLYRDYTTAKRKRDRSRMKSSCSGIICICQVACRGLRPHWEPPVSPEGTISTHPYATFWLDARRDRLKFAERFVREELQRGMTMTEAQHIGRRCRLRLIDAIRSETRAARSSDEYHAAGRRSAQPSCRRQQIVAAHDAGLHGPEDATNVAIAKAWGCSEGWIRKLRKRLAASLWSVAENDEQRTALEVLRLIPKGPAARC